MHGHLHLHTQYTSLSTLDVASYYGIGDSEMTSCIPFFQIVTLEDQLHRAAMSGDANRVESLIRDGVNVNAMTKVCMLVFDWLVMSL